MPYESVDAMMNDAPNVMKRRLNSEHIAANGVNNLEKTAQGFDNDKGIAVAEIATEVFVAARVLQEVAARGVLAAAVYGLLEGAAAASRGGPPGMVQATQAATKKAVADLVQRHKEQQESRAAMIAEIKYNKELHIASKGILERLGAATLASTQPISEEVQQSMDDATFAFSSRPKDPSTMNLGTA